MPTVGLLVLALGACTAYKSLIGENTVSLQGADVLSMQADIRRPVKKICPREPVQMWVRVEAKLEDQNSPARLETWVGDRQARRNGFLDFGNFVFASGQGTVDRLGQRPGRLGRRPLPQPARHPAALTDARSWPSTVAQAVGRTETARTGVSPILER